MLEKQDTQSCLGVHCMGSSVLHLKLICFNELHFKLANVLKDIW